MSWEGGGDRDSFFFLFSFFFQDVRCGVRCGGGERQGKGRDGIREMCTAMRKLVGRRPGGERGVE